NLCKFVDRFARIFEIAIRGVWMTEDCYELQNTLLDGAVGLMLRGATLRRLKQKRDKTATREAKEIGSWHEHFPLPVTILYCRINSSIVSRGTSSLSRFSVSHLRKS